MEKDEYRTMYELEDSYWWFAGRRHLVRRLCADLRLRPDARILDAGCGTGAGLDNLDPFGHAYGLDVSADALRFCRQRGKRRLVATSLESPGLRDDAFDVVTMLDVLEHVEDDARVLQALLRVLRPGGKLILTVPAYPFLWSEHDEALHHKRRYRARELLLKVKEAGFALRHASGLVSSFLPLIVGFRLLQKLFPHSEGPKTSWVVLPAPANALLKAILMAEVEVSLHLPLPVGVTFYLVAEKPALVTVSVKQSLVAALPPAAAAAGVTRGAALQQAE